MSHIPLHRQFDTGLLLSGIQKDQDSADFQIVSVSPGHFLISGMTRPPTTGKPGPIGGLPPDSGPGPTFPVPEPPKPGDELVERGAADRSVASGRLVATIDVPPDVETASIDWGGLWETVKDLGSKAKDVLLGDGGASGGGTGGQGSNPGGGGGAGNRDGGDGGDGGGNITIEKKGGGGGQGGNPGGGGGQGGQTGGAGGAGGGNTSTNTNNGTITIIIKIFG